MTVEELLARCELVRASDEKLAECTPFSCETGTRYLFHIIF